MTQSKFEKGVDYNRKLFSYFLLRRLFFATPFEFGMLFYDGYAEIWRFTQVNTGQFLCGSLSPAWAMFVMGLIACILMIILETVIAMPLEFYRTFCIDKPFGLTEATPVSVLWE